MQDLAAMTAVILAGGLGTRLRPLISDRPKVLADIHGRPFLALLLDHIAAAGIRSVVLCTGYMGAQVQAAFGTDYRGLCLRYSQETSPLGTGGALRQTLPVLASDSILVMNGDSFCEVDLSAFWTWYCGRNADGAILLTRAADTRRYGSVQVDAEGRVCGFDEKSEVSRPGWVNAGVYLFKRYLLSTIPASSPVSLERQMFPEWVQRLIYGYLSTSRFLDIGTPETYALAEQFFPSTNRP